MAYIMEPTKLGEYTGTTANIETHHHSLTSSHASIGDAPGRVAPSPASPWPRARLDDLSAGFRGEWMPPEHEALLGLAQGQATQDGDEFLPSFPAQYTAPYNRQPTGNQSRTKSATDLNKHTQPHAPRFSQGYPVLAGIHTGTCHTCYTWL